MNPLTPKKFLILHLLWHAILFTVFTALKLLILTVIFSRASYEFIDIILFPIMLICFFCIFPILSCRLAVSLTIRKHTVKLTDIPIITQGFWLSLGIAPSLLVLLYLALRPSSPSWFLIGGAITGYVFTVVVARTGFLKETKKEEHILTDDF